MIIFPVVDYETLLRKSTFPAKPCTCLWAIIGSAIRGMFFDMDVSFFPDRFCRIKSFKVLNKKFQSFKFQSENTRGDWLNARARRNNLTSALARVKLFLRREG